MLGAIVVGGILAAVLFPRFLRWTRAAAAERDLVRRCKGDTGQAERLIQYEVRRRPGLSRGAAAGRALESLERDNR